MAYWQHLEAFVQLGNFFNKFSKSDTIDNDPWMERLSDCLSRAQLQNAWFTPDNLNFALKQWGEVLQASHLENWLSVYKGHNSKQPKKIAIIMAGNIPLVGFHDFLCVLLAGHRVLAKLSSNDQLLLPFIKEYLVHCDPTLEVKIEFTDEKLLGFDAVIATGSNNTGRYFEYYFGKYPNIIRKNRNSVAVLKGDESPEQLEALGVDIFRYFGLGCRSVSKLFVPKDYDFEKFFMSIFPWKDLLDHHKFVNNYDYNKAVYLMSDIQLRDNGFLILKEDAGYASPIATVFYEFYEDGNSLKAKLKEDRESIQCVVAADGFMEGTVPFGQTQTPQLQDYADGVDTLKFLTGDWVGA